MCMQYFSADELTMGEIPEMETTQQHVYFVLLSLGVGALSHPLHVYTIVLCSVYTRVLSYDHDSRIERNSRSVTNFVL